MFEFKQLEIKPEGSAVKRFLKSPQTIKAIIFFVIGSTIGFLYYWANGVLDFKHISDIMLDTLAGGFFGLFLANTPCGRGKC